VKTLNKCARRRVCVLGGDGGVSRWSAVGQVALGVTGGCAAAVGRLRAACSSCAFWHDTWPANRERLPRVFRRSCANPLPPPHPSRSKAARMVIVSRFSLPLPRVACVVVGLCLFWRCCPSVSQKSALPGPGHYLLRHDRVVVRSPGSNAVSVVVLLGLSMDFFMFFKTRGLDAVM